MPGYFPYGKPPTSGMIRRNILSIGANSVNHGASFNSENISSLAVKDITTGLGVDPIYTHETTRSGEETAR